MRLPQNAVGDFEFADVVEQRAMFDLLQRFSLHPVPFRNTNRQVGHSSGMAARAFVSVVKG
jgi:hypothetical protein